ncbi:hypothetical protein Tco_0403061 [Tanacetum coccineum]
MSIEEMMHEQQLVDKEIKEIINDLGYKRFRGEEIDEEYERDCEIRIRKLKQDFNEWGSEVRKKEQAYNEEQYSAARRRMLSIPLLITTMSILFKLKNISRNCLLQSHLLYHSRSPLTFS